MVLSLFLALLEPSRGPIYNENIGMRDRVSEPTAEIQLRVVIG